jgi:hypothetical protein
LQSSPFFLYSLQMVWGLILASTTSSDRRWTLTRIRWPVTVNNVFRTTLTKASKRFKFND